MDMEDTVTSCISWEEFQEKLEGWEEEEREFIEEERYIDYGCNDDDSEDAESYKYEKAFLLIQAPMESEISEKNFPKLKFLKPAEKLEFADNLRTSQYENFCMLHPDLKNVDPKVTEQDFVTVCKYNEMTSSLTSFLESYGRKAKAASLCFSGYSDNDSEENGNDVNPRCKIKMAFLLIQTPAGLTNKHVEFLDPDVEQHSSDYEKIHQQHPDYCTLHPQLKRVDRKVSVIECVTAQDYDEMKLAVTEFIEKYGHKSVAASMYFYGKSDNNNEERSHDGYEDGSDEKKGSDGEEKGHKVNTSHILKKAFLLIQPPTNENMTNRCRSTTELEAPKQHASASSESPKVTICERISVYSYDEMKSAVNAFMENLGKKTLVASVYFNGHGKPLANDPERAQLCFDRPMQEDENLDTVLLNLEDIWSKSTHSTKNEYPWQFNVFFFQCYSHLHHTQGSDDGRMQVCHYTSNIDPRTQFRVRKDELTLKYSHHQQLEKHASDLEEQACAGGK